MPKIFFLFFFALFLTACSAPAATQTVGASGGVTPSPSIPSPTISPSPSVSPSSTPRPTRTLTPLPTIPTFTPTFDARTIVTVTLAPKATCPKEDPSLSIHLSEDVLVSSDIYELRKKEGQQIIDALNKGLSIATLKAETQKQKIALNWESRIHYQDLTGDGIVEVVLPVISTFILGCQNGQYATLLELETDGYLRAPSIYDVRDNNHNGIPELTFLIGIWSQGGHAYAIYEWNGTKFINLIPSDRAEYPDAGEIWVEATGKIHFEDTNHDAVQELILDSGIPVGEGYYSGLPWRNKRTQYDWNGQKYASGKVEFDQPEFRFQAVQDGDLMVKQGENIKALDLYQQAIFSDKLQDYSLQMRKYLQALSIIGAQDKASPTAPLVDSTEYPRLAAYAYYRMVILHIHLGEMHAANIQYATLQNKFPAGNPGHPYAEMATRFWDVYQTSGKMYNACAAAIAYVDAHPEILTPLGSDYHGWQSHTYTPADVCPFR